MRLWGGRFSEENDRRVADFTRSVELDRALAADDIAGSIAHVRGLGRAGLLTDDEVATLVGGLEGLPAPSPRLDRLGSGARGRPPQPRGGAGRADRAGRRQAPHRPLAQRPGRHRPSALAAPGDRPARRGAARLRARARRPGRARGHGRPARHDPHPAGPARAVRPSPAGLRRDGRARPGPAGRCAPAGERLAARRRRAGRAPATRSTARRRPHDLGFDGVTANSLDAVSDRDFVVETLAATALGMVHLSRLAEEITWWSNPRFGFVRVDDAFSTGSSMMPNKKNPDPAELVRGRAARVIGALTGAARDAQGAAARRTSGTSRRTRRRCSTRSPSTRRRWA